ncbi:ArgE/DapE family deacylase [Paenibacillus sp. FSL R10-2199]|jgi:acetylornithine deacetylase|uniref:ArgE/DapE family deacylase n=1 Tax=Paenibacillus sp. FSL R10-2199 TaxID=2975348 RepID=UPI0030F82EF0
MMNQEQQVMEWIEDHQEEILEFLQQLIQIPSVNPWFFDEPGPSKEKEVQEFISRKLEGLGAEIEMWEPNADDLKPYEGMAGYYPGRDFTGRPNLAATFGKDAPGKSLLLFGHIDVVMAGSKWTVDPFEGTIMDGKMYGRGTVDMKGGVAAMIMAVEAVLGSGLKLKGPVVVGTVVDEEAGGMGALDFIHHGYRADACILTEPTSLTIAPLCRGILWGKIKIQGRSGHIEMPQADWKDGGAVDSIKKARYILDAFDRLNEQWAVSKTHPYLSIPCQVHVAQLNAGEYPTSFANEAEIVFNAQYLPSERDEKLVGGNVKKELTDFLRQAALQDPWLSEHLPEIEWMVDADCAETDVAHPFVQTCVQSLQAIGEAGTIEGLGFHTDMGWPVNVGIPTINFGPGDPSLAHHSDEFTPVHEVIQAVKMIAKTIIDWCGTEKA